MTTHTARLLGTVLLLAGAIGVAQQRKQQEIDLQAAIRKETVEGDLNGAIKQYSAIVSKYKTDRATTAMALVRMADCYRKMGDAESRKLYERVVKEYADQKQAVALARTGLGGGTQTRPQTNTLVWSGPRVFVDGTVTPDGRLFSFIDGETGDAAVRDIATGADRRLTNTGNTRGNWKDFGEDSAISRDGKQIAFSYYLAAQRRYDLRLVNVTGEPNPRRLFFDPKLEWIATRDWSPDGKSIAVLLEWPDHEAAIGLVSTADGSLRRLPTGRFGVRSQRYPVVFFSPDGRYLAYDLPETALPEPRDLFLFDIAANREIPIVVRRGQDVMIGWSPDGKRLLFGSDRSGSLGLWAQTLENGQVQGAPELLKPDLGAAEPLGVTQAGALYYALTTSTASSRLYIGAIDFASGRIPSFRDVSENYRESHSSPVWSPDGRQLAYLSRGRGAGASTVIAIRSAETKQLLREIPSRVLGLSGWAPDSQSLLGIGVLDGRRGAMRIDPQTGAVTPLVMDPVQSESLFLDAAWSPDGRGLYYARSFGRGAEFAFFKRDFELGAETELIRRPMLGVLNLSPDGKFLVTATVDQSSNSRVLLLIPTDGGGAREIMRVPSGLEAAELKAMQKGQIVYAPIWAPDSKSLIFRRRTATDAVTHELWTLPLGGGEPRKLEATVHNQHTLYGVHPDGTRILLTGSSGESFRQRQVWVLENFLPASQVAPPAIGRCDSVRFMRFRLPIALVCALVLGHAADWKPADNPLTTPWTSKVKADAPLPEYPRPQMVREKWTNLNGLWDYAIAGKDAAPPQKFEGSLLVPFPVESALSGVKKPVSPEQLLWYRRTFTASPARGSRVLLHFGAVDWRAEVFVNGKSVGTHEGGYDPFTLDVTAALKAQGKQELVVSVWDPTDTGLQPRGKQVLNPNGIWYTAVTGIWQTVWLETVSATHIRELTMTPDLDGKRLRLTVDASTPTDFTATARLRGQVVARVQGKTGTEASLALSTVEPWSPDSPTLYDLEVALKAGDSVKSYFGMRKVDFRKDSAGINRIFLNNQPLFMIGPLDQGWWPDGLYTAPTDEALRSDIDAMKKLGFNMARKHVKVEPARWYYWCDKLGFLVWQDLPSAMFSGGTREKPNPTNVRKGVAEDAKFPPDADARFRRELETMMRQLHNAPSIVVWVPFNEGWGQHDTNEILRWVKSLDASRLVDGPSGWEDRGYGDIKDMHEYPGPNMFPVVADRVSVLGEFGGLGLPLPDHLWWDKRNWGYRTFTDRATLQTAYEGLIEKLAPLVKQGLAAAIYTQTTDVEGEVNGLLTYDRKVVKFDAAKLAELHRKLQYPQ